jgi:hypothetical protein
MNPTIGERVNTALIVIACSGFVVWAASVVLGAWAVKP